MVEDNRRVKNDEGDYLVMEDGTIKVDLAISLDDLIHHDEEWLWDKANDKVGFILSGPSYYFIGSKNNKVKIRVKGYREE